MLFREGGLFFFVFPLKGDWSLSLSVFLASLLLNNSINDGPNIPERNVIYPCVQFSRLTELYTGWHEGTWAATISWLSLYIANCTNMNWYYFDHLIFTLSFLIICQAKMSFAGSSFYNVRTCYCYLSFNGIDLFPVSLSTFATLNIARFTVLTYLILLYCILWRIQNE